MTPKERALLVTAANLLAAMLKILQGFPLIRGHFTGELNNALHAFQNAKEFYDRP